MTDVYGPFDGANWTQSNWYRDAPFWTPSGVFGSPASSTSTGDLPLTTSGLNITIGTGRAHVRGASFERSGTPASQAVTTNGNASLSRRDRVVLRRDLAAKTVTPVVIAGTASASPTPPTITQSENGQWDLPLFSFLVPPNNGTNLTSFIDERAWVNPASPGVSAFSTAAARDANLLSPTDGTLCLVGGVSQVYRSSSWRGTTSLVYSTTAADGTAYYASHVIMTLAVPDPGFPYMLDIAGSVLMQTVGASVNIDCQAQVGGSGIAPKGDTIFQGSTVSNALMRFGGATTGTLTGSSTVTFYVNLNSAPAGNGYQAFPTAPQNSLRALVIPA